MAIDLYHGWDQEVIGDAVFTINGTPYTIDEGRFCHIDIDSLFGAGIYDDFATAVAAAISDEGVAVTYNSTNLTYTLSHASNFTVSLNTVAQQALGIGTGLSGANSYTSTKRPYFVVRPTLTDISNWSPPSEIEGIYRVSIAADGSRYGVQTINTAYEESWSHRYEQAPETTSPGARGTYIYSTLAASTNQPYSWQQFFQGAGVKQPIVRYDGSFPVVYYFTEEGAPFSSANQLLEISDLVTLWRLNIKCHYLGTAS